MTIRIVMGTVMTIASMRIRIVGGAIMRIAIMTGTVITIPFDCTGSVSRVARE
jgi:hypothetical protein